MSKGIYGLTIQLDNLKEAQLIALLGMIKIMDSDSRVGHSEYVGFFVDGNGDFHPNINVETEYQISDERLDELSRISIKKQTSTCTLIDYDPIAWRLSKEKGEW